MIKTQIKAIFILSLLITLLSCSSENKKSNQIKVRSNFKVITPLEMQNSKNLSPSEVVSLQERKNLVPLLEIDKNKEILIIKDINLDKDTEDEQIVIAQTSVDLTTSSKENLDLFVIDYNTEKGKYEFLLKTKLSTDSFEGLSILSQDITGNHKSEILISGFTSQGFHSLDAFKIIETKKSFKFSKIINLKINGTIDILTQSRSNAYTNEGKGGKSFPIVTEETSVKNQDNLDITKTTYLWMVNRGRYLKTSEITIPGATISEKKLQTLYKGKLNGFIDFLSGPWYREKDLAGHKIPLLEDIIYFNTNEKLINFTREGMQEIYTWEDTRRTIFKGIYIRSKNILTKSLRKDIYITVEKLDTIRLKIQGTSEWGGYYTQLNPKLQKQMIPNNHLKYSDNDISLSGKFTNSLKEELFFDKPKFSLKKNNQKTENGFYSLFNLKNKNILEIRFLKTNGQFDHREIYQINLKKEEDITRIIYTLSLQPGYLNTLGFTAEAGSDPIHYEQIEIKDDQVEE